MRWNLSPAAAGPAPRNDESILRFLIELAVNPELRTKFSAAPLAAINDISPDMSDEEKKAILERNSVGIRDSPGADPLQHGASAQRPVESPQTVKTETASALTGTSGRRRVVRVEVEFED